MPGTERFDLARRLVTRGTGQRAGTDHPNQTQGGYHANTYNVYTQCRAECQHCIFGDTNHVCSLAVQQTHFSPISVYRDLKDIGNPHPDVQQALAKQIRDACIDVGFFYGAVPANSHRFSLTGGCSHEPWYPRGSYRIRP